jgi:hypothetical protein
MKQYLAVGFDGWYSSWHLIKEEELKKWNDGSFDFDRYKHKFYEIVKEVTKEELFPESEKITY